MLTVLFELIIQCEKHSIKTNRSDIGKTNVSSLNKRVTENALLNQTLALTYTVLLQNTRSRALTN